MLLKSGSPLFWRPGISYPETVWPITWSIGEFQRTFKRAFNIGLIYLDLSSRLWVKCWFHIAELDTFALKVIVTESVRLDLPWWSPDFCFQAGVKSPLVMLANCKMSKAAWGRGKYYVLFSWLAIWYLSQMVFIPLSGPEVVSEPCREVTRLSNAQIMKGRWSLTGLHR